jgi:anti-sigma B factor antagonist
MTEPFVVTDGEVRGRLAVLRVRGRLDARSAPLLVRRCNEVRSAGGWLVLNLAAVSFLSSSGVGALMALTESARDDHGAVRLAEASAAVRSVLDVLNLQPYLALDDSEDAARAALEAAA